MNDAERIRLAFVGGHLRRWHASDIMGEERVDSHTWGMVTILLVLHPCPSLALIAAVQFHDAGEMFSGDIPHPAKAAVPALGEGDREVGCRWAAATGMGDQELDQADRWWLSFTDMAQAYLFCGRQLAMGNSLMGDTWWRIQGHLEGMRGPGSPSWAHNAVQAVLEADVTSCTTRDITELEEQA